MDGRPQGTKAGDNPVEERFELLILFAPGFANAESDYCDFGPAFLLSPCPAPFAFLSLIPSDRISNRLGQLNGQTGAAPGQTVSPTA